MFRAYRDLWLLKNVTALLQHRGVLGCLLHLHQLVPSIPYVGDTPSLFPSQPSKDIPKGRGKCWRGKLEGAGGGGIKRN